MSELISQKQEYSQVSQFVTDKNTFLQDGFNKMAGMTPNQFKIFRHLSTNGLKSVPQLSKEIGIPRTQTYAMLRSMQKKGAVKLKHKKPFRFEAVPIEEFLERRIMLEYKKLEDLEKILMPLKH